MVSANGFPATGSKGLDYNHWDTMTSRAMPCPLLNYWDSECRPQKWRKDQEQENYCSPTSPDLFWFDLCDSYEMLTLYKMQMNAL